MLCICLFEESFVFVVLWELVVVYVVIGGCMMNMKWMFVYVLVVFDVLL